MTRWRLYDARLPLLKLNHFWVQIKKNFFRRRFSYFGGFILANWKWWNLWSNFCRFIFQPPIRRVQSRKNTYVKTRFIYTHKFFVSIAVSAIWSLFHVRILFDHPFQGLESKLRDTLFPEQMIWVIVFWKIVPFESTMAYPFRQAFVGIYTLFPI